eukprot:CAMPEP_0196808456 /NCGR_PEP_ID=MMETSP1362-20130617/8438_1 /TAXON_ID=163516 /ORGANISM="Leptocylindrus danicus, Strain CCMP1856" /LENGTH=292 /DNA_ID=CAMNT_0042182803 /DNA_START=135 /DNA_END=1013 /DNA_ORIENTATION=-
MAILAPLVESFTEGMLALINGTLLSLKSPTILAHYRKFLIQFIIITILGLTALSATLVAAIPLACFIIFGPIVGPAIFITGSYIALLSLFVLWCIGQFPYNLLVFGAQWGVLKPYYSITQISFLLASLLVSAGCDKFLLAGISACYDKDYAKRVSYMYRKPGLIKTLYLTCMNVSFGLVIRFVFFVLLSSIGNWAVVDACITAFLLGSQMVSVYTVRIRCMSFLEHVGWCLRIKNILKIIGFALPLHLIDCYSYSGGGSGNIIVLSWVSTVIWLGLGYSATAALVKDLVVMQ